MSFEEFNQDIEAHGGYIYTSNNKLSSITAAARQTETLLDLGNYRDKTVIDIGCGDGICTVELFDRGRPASIHGIDAAAKAVENARKRVGDRAITFSVGSAYDLPFPENSFDIAQMRAILHHLDDPADALREALRVAPVVVVLEPNGYNPVLKVLEKVHPYHRAHHEKSYAPHRIDRWVRRHGGEVSDRRLIGIVPYFCPDWMVRLLKKIEPLAEKTVLVNTFGCAHYVFRAARRQAFRLADAPAFVSSAQPAEPTVR